jgi:hypothetical protein
MIQCFIKRNKSKSTYHLYLCLSNGKPCALLTFNLTAHVFYLARMSHIL